MLMDSMYYTGYWHDGKTVRVVNWPEWRVERLEWTAPSRPWFNGMALGQRSGSPSRSYGLRTVEQARADPVAMGQFPERDWFAPSH